MAAARCARSVRRLTTVTMTDQQLTLALLKPDVCSQPIMRNNLLHIIRINGFNVVRSKRMRWTEADAQQFYAEHKDRFFYERLVTFMSSGPFDALVLGRKDAIPVWRSLMGPTKVYRSKFEQPQCLRAIFGTTDTRNATHGSDSVESATKEISLFFPQDSYQQLLEEHIAQLQANDGSQQTVDNEAARVIEQGSKKNNSSMA